MMRFHYIFFAIVAVTGLGATWLLLPSTSETGLMHLKEKRLDTARATFEDLLNKGDYSLDVVMPLVDIYLQYGETDKAIQPAGKVFGSRQLVTRGDHKTGAGEPGGGSSARIHARSRDTRAGAAQSGNTASARTRLPLF